METITDEQVRRWILQKLYDQGFKNLYFNECINDLCSSDVPPKTNCNGELWTGFNGKLSDFVSLEKFITINKPYIDIEKELGIIDWSKVPVDTPVVALDSDGNGHRRHFAKYEDGVVYTWIDGRTSWTANGSMYCGYNVLRLADVDKEQLE